jgi:hypothetical protein
MITWIPARSLDRVYFFIRISALKSRAIILKGQYSSWQVSSFEKKG